MLSLTARGIQYTSQLAMVLIVPKALAPVAYVQLNLVLPLAFLGVSFVFGWLTNAIFRHVYELFDKDNVRLKQTVFAYYGFVSLACVVFFLATSAFTNSIYRLIPLLLMAAGLKNALLGVLNASSNHKGFFFATLGFSLALAVFIVLCFLDTNGALARNLIIYAALETIVAVITWRLIGVFVFRSPACFDLEIVKRYFRYGWPLVANVVAIWVISLSDRYLLTIWRAADEVAGYILSYQLAGSIITVPMSFVVTVIFPKILRIDREKGEAAALSYTYGLLKVYLRYIPVMFIVACGIVLPLMYYMYPAYIFNPYIIVIIVLAHVILGLSHFYNKEFELNGRTAVITKGTIVGAIANIGLNVMFIPMFGALGAALTTLAAYSITVYAVYRARRFNPRIKMI
jgi:O-antigen/teichoic acid export membrane protein